MARTCKRNKALCENMFEMFDAVLERISCLGTSIQRRRSTYHGAVKNTMTGRGIEGERAASAKSSSDVTILPPDLAAMCREVKLLNDTEETAGRSVMNAVDLDSKAFDAEITLDKVNNERKTVLASHRCRDLGFVIVVCESGKRAFHTNEKQRYLLPADFLVPCSMPCSQRCFSQGTKYFEFLSNATKDTLYRL